MLIHLLVFVYVVLQLKYFLYGCHFLIKINGIRKCLISKSEESQEKKCYLGSEVSIKIDIEDVFKAFCDSQKPPLPKEVVSTCKDLLKKGYSLES